AMVSAVEIRLAAGARRRRLERAGLLHPDRKQSWGALLHGREPLDEVQIKYEIPQAHIADGAHVTAGAPITATPEPPSTWWQTASRSQGCWACLTSTLMHARRGRCSRVPSTPSVSSAGFDRRG